MKIKLLQIRKASKPMTRTEVFLGNTIPWVAIGLLIATGITAAADKDWAMTAVGLIGAGVFWWVMWWSMGQKGYIDAMHQAYMERYTSKQQKEN